jgi:hypothetical protein
MTETPRFAARSVTTPSAPSAPSTPSAPSAPVPLTDEQIAALSPTQRQALVARLLEAAPRDPDPAGEVHVENRSDWWPSTSPSALKARIERRRHRMLLLLITICALMLPWIGYLMATLPHRYLASWLTTWVGFDVALLLVLTATVYFGWRHRQLVMVSAYTGGVLLLCDAWFDVSTASGQDTPLALISAIGVELPIGLLLLHGAARLLGLLIETANRGQADLLHEPLSVLVGHIWSALVHVPAATE